MENKKYRDGDPKSVDTEIECIPSVVAFCMPFLTTRKEGVFFFCIIILLIKNNKGWN